MTTITSFSSISQQKQLRTKLIDDFDGRILEQLSSVCTEHASKNDKDFTRKRLFTPITTLWTFLNQVLSQDHSCKKALSMLNAYRVSRSLTPCSIQTGSYCTARKKLSVEFIKQVTEGVFKNCEKLTEDEWRWKDLSLSVVDGTVVTAADSRENQSRFPQLRSLKKGAGFPLVRMVGLFSFTTGALNALEIDSYSGKGSGESSLFLKILKNNLGTRDLILMDAGFFNYRVIDGVEKKHCKYISKDPGRRKINFRLGKKLGKKDHVIKIKKTHKSNYTCSNEEYELLGEEYFVREFELIVKQPGFRTKKMIITTNLLDAKKYPKEEIAEIFRGRWEVELNYRSIKSVLQMNHLRCKTPEMVEKEIWLHMLGYNFIRNKMVESGIVFSIHPTELSFKASLQLYNSFILLLFDSDENTKENLEASLLELISNNIVGTRPGRIEPRAKRFLGTQYTHLIYPRDIARKMRMGRKHRSKKDCDRRKKERRVKT